MTRQSGLDWIFNCGEVTRRLRMTLAGFVWTNFSPSLVTRMFLSSWYMEDIFHMQVLSPFFRKQKEGQNAFLSSAVFQMPLTQNNQYARSAYMEVVCSELFHYICYLLFSRYVWLFMTHGLQHTRLPCPLLYLRLCSNSCPLSGDAITIWEIFNTKFSFSREFWGSCQRDD